jgi:predicted nucleotidyltransferase
MFNADKARNFLIDSDRIVSRLCETSKNLADLSRYEDVRRTIKSITEKAQFGSPKVHLFGSRVIGVGTDASDLDIFVEIGGNFSNRLVASHSTDHRFNRLADAVEEHRDWRVDERVLRTRVPVIKTVYKPQQLECRKN